MWGSVPMVKAVVTVVEAFRGGDVGARGAATLRLDSRFDPIDPEVDSREYLGRLAQVNNDAHQYILDRRLVERHIQKLRQCTAAADLPEVAQILPTPRARRLALWDVAVFERQGRLWIDLVVRVHVPLHQRALAASLRSAVVRRWGSRYLVLLSEGWVATTKPLEWECKLEGAEEKRHRGTCDPTKMAVGSTGSFVAFRA